MKTLVIHITGTERGSGAAYLYLPACEGELHDALDRARLRHDDPYKILRAAYPFQKDYLPDFPQNFLDMLQDGPVYELQPTPIEWLPEDTTLQELNYMASELQLMPLEQRIAFRALADLETGYTTMSQYLNLLHNTDKVYTIQAANAVELGQHHLNADREDRERQRYPGATALKAAAEAQAELGGVFIAGRYVGRVDGVPYDNIYREEMLGDNLPMLDTVFHLTLAPRDSSVKWERTHEISLPATKEERQALYQTMGMQDDSECTTEVIRCPIISAFDGMHADFGVESLQALAEIIRELKEDGQLAKYKAVLEQAEEGSEAHYLELAESLDLYEFHPTYRHEDDLVREFLQHRYALLDPEFYENVNLSQFGEVLMERYGYHDTEYGFVRGIYQGYGDILIPQENLPGTGQSPSVCPEMA